MIDIENANVYLGCRIWWGSRLGSALWLLWAQPGAGAVLLRCLLFPGRASPAHETLQLCGGERTNRAALCLCGRPGTGTTHIKVKAAGRAVGWRKIRPPALSPCLSSYLQTCLQGFILLPFGSPRLCTGQRQIEMAVKILIGTSRYLFL